MSSVLFSWQHDAWRQFQQLRERLPHAMVFHGPQGIGKTVFAEAIAQSLLCEAPVADGYACGQCISCGWFRQHSHPDYRRVRPEILEESNSSAEESENEPEDGKKTTRSSHSKSASKDIRIDQIRALADFMNISTHRRGWRVITLYPAEALNAAAANALLKTLEEPPPDSVFLLICHSLDRLLPTILSRCRKFAMTIPAPEEALIWLKTQGVKEPEMLLAEQGGAPLAAYALAQTDSHEVRTAFLNQLAKPSVESALKMAEQLQKMPIGELVLWLQRWLYDIFSLKLSGKIRYYPRYHQQLAMLASQTEAGKLLRALKVANERRAIGEHPLSAKLFIEDMLLDYLTLFS